MSVGNDVKAKEEGAMRNGQTEANGSVEVHACGDTSALHASTADGLVNLVGIGNLRIIVKNDGGRWSAQGLEIDYAVDGASFEDVTEEFAHGLMLTIDEHLHVFGHIRNVLKTAPPDVWDEFYDGVLSEKLELSHSQFSIHKLPAQVYIAKAA